MKLTDNIINISPKSTPTRWTKSYNNRTCWFKGLRLVLEGFVVSIHEGACETGSQIPRALARCIWRTVRTDSGHDGHKPERPKPKRPQTETATNRNGHKPKRPQTETPTDRNGHRPKRPQTEKATNRNGHKPERPQTQTATNRNGHK